jgi:hypothetical protein
MGDYPIRERSRHEAAQYGHPMDTEDPLSKYLSSVIDRALNAAVNTKKYEAALRSIAVRYFRSYKIKENTAAGEQLPSEHEAVTTYLNHLKRAQEDHWEMCVLVIDWNMKSKRGETVRNRKRAPPFTLQKQRVRINATVGPTMIAQTP